MIMDMTKDGVIAGFVMMVFGIGYPMKAGVRYPLFGMMENSRTSLRFIFSRPRYLTFFWLVQFFFLALIET